MTTPDTAVHVRNISVQYRRTRRDPVFRALDDVSIRLERGRTVGVVGESGSGKSTLARAILGLTPVSTGTITVGEVEVTRPGTIDRIRLAATLQAVFQDPTGSLNPSYTVGRSLAEPVRAQPELRGSDLAALIAQSLERVGLDPSAADKLPREFSGGQRQRICIARALMTSPRFLICDEAVSALDLSVQAQILNLLMDLQDSAGLAYLFISHDMNVVRRMCHEVVVLYRGAVMESGPTSVVTSTPAHPYTKALMQAAPVADPRVQASRRATATRTTARTTTSASAPTAPGCPFADRCAFARDICTTSTPALRAIGAGVSVACHRYPEWTHQAALG